MLVVMLDPDVPTPLYEQLAEIIRRQVESGELTGKVPSVRTLAQQYDISLRTAAHALSFLKDQGVLVARVGKGYYVAR
jgi:DNA-binding GntR family transcriptional regulator